MAKIVRIEAKGGPENLSLVESEVAKPGPGEARIRVQAFALNRADIRYMQGKHYMKLALPSRVGSEAAGVVDAVGPGVESLKIGDRVSSVPFFSQEPNRHGVQGEFAIVPARYLAPWPEGFSAAEACSVWMQYLTAYYALVSVGGLSEGKNVLITAASSSAGSGAIHLAKTIGATAIATTRQPEKVAFLKSSGADYVIVTRPDEDFAWQIRHHLGGQGVDVVYDPISGSFIKNYVNGLNWGARIIIYGSLAGTEINVPNLPLVRANATIHPYSMFNHVVSLDQLNEGICFVMDQISKGNFRPAIDRVFGLEETADAYRHMLGNTQCGKIVVQVGDLVARSNPW